MYETLKYEVKEGIAYVTVDRPEALNALNSKVISELYDAFAAFDADADAQVAILTGEGRSFVAGADIAEMSKLNTIEARDFAKTGHRTMNLIENVSKPVIAAVNGFALGGGCELTLACDIRVASENARFALPEVSLGIIPGGGGTQRLSRIIGVGRAKELIFTCDQVDAENAYRMGLANHVVPQEELMEFCMKMAEKIASRASYAVSLAKASVNASMNVDVISGGNREMDLLGMAFATGDKQEGMEAFLARRKPEFHDF